MASATWNGAVTAESEETIVVEGNHYFPRSSIHEEFFGESSSHTTCSWKGIASYYDVVVNGQVNPDAAWYYPAPSKAAEKIKNYVDFWRAVKVEE